MWHPNQTFLRPDLVAEARALDLVVIPWTFNELTAASLRQPPGKAEIECISFAIAPSGSMSILLPQTCFVIRENRICLSS